MRNVLARAGLLTCSIIVVPLIGVDARAEKACPTSLCAGGTDSGCGAGGFGDTLNQICSLAPGHACVDQCGCCRNEQTDVFAGVTFAPPPPIPPPAWPGLGGRGRLAAETELCLLRDIGKLPGGLTLDAADVSVAPLGDAKLRQRVGLVSFDPVAKTMEGFHSVSVCIPPFGCVDNQVQRFTAALASGTPAAGQNCGDYVFSDAYALRVATTDNEHSLDVEFPSIEVYTPYGTVSATPLFKLETALKNGFPTDVNFDVEPMCSIFESDLSPLVGLVDGPVGVDFLCAVLDSTSSWPGYGDIGQIALGGRSPNPKQPLYQAGTPRPDLKLEIARTSDENKPVERAAAAARFEYSVVDLIPSEFNDDPFELTAKVFVLPSIESRFASQVQIYGSDAAYRLKQFQGDCNTPNYNRAHVVLQSHPESYVGFKVEAGFDLVLKLEHDFGGFIGTIKVTLLEKHPKFDAVPEIGTPGAGPTRRAEATFKDSPIPAILDLTSFSAGPVADPQAFLNECFMTPPPAGETPPTSSFTPDNPRKLTKVLEFPCNICLGWGNLSVGCGPDTAHGVPADHACEFTDGVCSAGCILYPIPPELIPTGAPIATNVLFPALQEVAGETWLCDAPEKAGCFDLCTYDPTAAQPLEVVRSAVELNPSCGVPVTSSTVCVTVAQCDDRNPCTLDTCVGSEFGYCQHAPAEGTCNDGLYCNGADRCALGACALHDGNPCATGQDCCNETTDSCVDTCPMPGPRCGNGLLQPGEACDDGNVAGGDGCSSICALECGNRTVDPGEECDDGNTLDDDGCSSICQLETIPLDCGTAYATTSELWPPNHQWVGVAIGGVTDASGNPPAITITGISQDEPLDGLGDGDTCPDGDGIGSSVARLRAERSGTAKTPGDGRVYHVTFTADDGAGGKCEGTVTVCVPHDRRPGHACVDQGTGIDSSGSCP